VHLFIVDGAVLGEGLVFAAGPAKQNHNGLLCPLPVFLWKTRRVREAEQQDFVCLLLLFLLLFALARELG